MKQPATENVTALEIVDGDIVYVGGARCRVRNVEHVTIDGRETARYALYSEPGPWRPHASLPECYEGMISGGNELAQVSREVRSAAPAC